MQALSHMRRSLKNPLKKSNLQNDILLQNQLPVFFMPAASIFVILFDDVHLYKYLKSIQSTFCFILILGGGGLS